MPQVDENANGEPRVTKTEPTTITIEPIVVTAGQSTERFVTVPGVSIIHSGAEDGSPIPVIPTTDLPTAIPTHSAAISAIPALDAADEYVDGWQRLHTSPSTAEYVTSPNFNVEGEGRATFSQQNHPYDYPDYNANVSYSDAVESTAAHDMPSLPEQYNMGSDEISSEYDSLMEEEHLSAQASELEGKKRGAKQQRDYTYSTTADAYGVPHDIDYSADSAEPQPADEGELLADAQRANAKRSDEHTRREEEQEYLEYLKKFDTPHTKRKKTPQNKQDSDAAAPILADGTQTSVALIEARLSYEIDRLKRRRRIDEYTFSTDGTGRRSGGRSTERSVSRRVKYLGKAKRCEQATSRAFYLAARDSYEVDPERRMRKSAEIDSVVRRMELLLSERVAIDNELIKLYTGATQGGSQTEFKRGSKRAERAARKMWRAQRKAAKHLDGLHAPLDLKERIYAMMNERTLAAADIEYSKAALRQRGLDRSQKRAHSKNISRQRKNIRYLEADIKHFMKKAERHNEKHKADKEHHVWLVVLAALLAVGGIAVLIIGKLWLGW